MQYLHICEERTGKSPSISVLDFNTRLSSECQTCNDMYSNIFKTDSGIFNMFHTIYTQFRCIPSFLDSYSISKKYAHGFCFAVLCCGYTLTDCPISIRLTSLPLWQSNDCPSASKATLMNMDKYFMWIHYERLHNHNKAKHNKTVCIFLGIYCIIGSGVIVWRPQWQWSNI